MPAHSFQSTTKAFAFIPCLLFSLHVALLQQLSAKDPVPPPIRNLLDLEAYASELAQKPYVAPDPELDPFFSNLNYDDHRRIQFRKDRSHYVQEGPVGVEFFHPGWMFKKPVHFHEIKSGQPLTLNFDPKDFDYFGLKIPEGVRYPDGFTGFKVLAMERDTGNRPEFLVFNGASYFRAVSSGTGWGLSARGVAINTLGSEPEEFPDFTQFWFFKPAKGDTTFRFLALLNGPSITGAYEFEVQSGETTVTAVTASLFLRRKVNMLGVAPFSSMFWFGENTQPKPLDFRREVHDSDGLLFEQKAGAVVWRPLDNGKQMRHSIFAIDHLKGFGLQKRDRDFANFEDLEAKYHERTSVWVEPKEGFGKGQIHLIELSTGEETWDNVVTMWEPDTQPTATQPLRLAYNLLWQESHQHPLAKVTATRWGEAAKALDLTNAYTFVIDFAKGVADAVRPPDWIPQCAVDLRGPGARVLSQVVTNDPTTGGWRVNLTLNIPPEVNFLELNCELRDGPQAISERWDYQWRR
ncbi:MAG: glucan biosynthesis protein [Verrucomicrobium sp.]|nr:glucan biosynthesis protein [Verrucomicrobium sp.]